MHRIYYSIFQRQYRAFRALQSDGRAPSWEDEALANATRRSMFLVEDALDDAASAIGPRFRLRADAKLLLGVNLQQMVALPLMLMAQQNPELARELDTPRGIEGTVREDAVTIARAAVDSRERGGSEGELSSSDVLRGVVKAMDELKLKDWRLWDRDG